MKKLFSLAVVSLFSVLAFGADFTLGYSEIEPIWDNVATNSCCIQWFEPPAAAVKTDVCLITISGGAYASLTDENLCVQMAKYFTDRGVTCVFLRYRCNKSGQPYYGVSLQDARRAVRIIRSQAAKRGFSPNKIGTFSHSAGSHLSLLLATDSRPEQWPGYDERTGNKAVAYHDLGDELDQTYSAKTDFAMTDAIAYALTDGDGSTNANGGLGASLNPYINLDPANPPAPMCMMHGCKDPWSPLASTLMFRELKRMDVPAQLHLFADREHGYYGSYKNLIAGWSFATYDHYPERYEEFLHSIGMLGEPKNPVSLLARFPNEATGVTVSTSAVWQGRTMPGAAGSTPTLEWSIPSKPVTTSVQILACDADSTVAATAVRRYMNLKGMAVVTLQARAGAAVQDLQRAVRVVRATAAEKGLSADYIGVMGFGVHGYAAYTLATKPGVVHYTAEDATDQLSDTLHWAFPVSITAPSGTGTLSDADVTFTGTESLPPILFITGSEDTVAAQNSVRAWEGIRAAGITNSRAADYQSELHSIVNNNREFWTTSEISTANATWYERIFEFFHHQNRVMMRSGFPKVYAPIETSEGTVTPHTHTWGTPTYTWTQTATGYTCAAKVSCTGDTTHTQTENGTVTYAEITPATTSATGTGRYTATFKNSLFTQKTKDVTLPKIEEEDPGTGPTPGGDDPVPGTALQPVAADNAAAIQSLIDAAAAAKGTVTLGEGLFEIKTQLMVTNGVTLVGQGRDKTTVKYVGTKDTATSRVMTVSGGSVVSHLTVTGGAIGSTGYAFGGGVYVENSGTISWCCIANNYNNNAFGGGIAVTGKGKTIIEHTIVRDNIGALNNGGRDPNGGGICIWGEGSTAPDVEIESCLIDGNRAGKSGGVVGNGGGIAIYGRGTADTATVHISNTTFSGNRVESSGIGGGLYVAQSKTYLSNCTFQGNTTVSGVGPQLAFASDAIASVVSGQMTNCVFESEIPPSEGVVLADYANYRDPSGIPQSVTLSYYDGPDTRGFAWQTALSVTQGKVWLRKGTYASAADIVGKSDTIEVTAVASARTECTSYTASVSNLSVGNWSYCLGYGDKTVCGQFAVRAEDGTLVALNVNDVETKYASKLNFFGNVVDGACSVLPDGFDFALSGGDFSHGSLYDVTNASEYAQWGAVIDTARSRFADTPWIMVAGNHETDRIQKFVSEHFEYTESGHYGCHAFKQGGACVVTLPFYTNYEEVPAGVTNWLVNVLSAASTDTWRVVALHAGPYTTGSHAASKYFIKQLTPIFAKYKVDLVLQAHDHTYSRTLPYRWSGAGYTQSETDSVNVNLAPATTNVTEIGGQPFYLNPEGTVYVTAGCAGHDVGEKSSYADRDGENSYASRVFKVVTDTVKVQSKYAVAGSDGSKDVGMPMFGVLKINGGRLTYDWYVAETDGTATLFDSLRICKSSGNAAAEGEVPAYVAGKSQSVIDKYTAWAAKNGADKTSAHEESFLLNCGTTTAAVTEAKAAFTITSVIYNETTGKWECEVTGEVGEGEQYGNGYVHFISVKEQFPGAGAESDFFKAVLLYAPVTSK